MNMDCPGTTLLIFQQHNQKKNVAYEVFKLVNCCLKIQMMSFNIIYPESRSIIILQTKTQELKTKLKNTFEKDILYFS